MTPSPVPARSSGILLHPTSLPSRFGVGDLGPAALDWVEALAQAGQRWWQVLPLGPTGYGDSPYQCFSAFAGNPLLVSPERLVEDGLLAPGDLPAALPPGPVDYGPAQRLKATLRARALERFRAVPIPAMRDQFDAFREAEAAWLEDFALFMALKGAHGGRAWTGWDPEVAARQPAALQAAGRSLAAAVDQVRFDQFLFFRQWAALRARARAAGIGLIGDAPIFLAHDSADLWAHRDLFLLDGRGAPRVVAGVPPDYFAATGQRWGNPLYDWAALAATGYAWWIERLRASTRLVDLLRLDHFIGFQNHWEIPAASPTAESGRWVVGPGAALFDAARAALGDLPIIAEDLGTITPAVEALRLRYGFPGMRVLQFAFGGAVEPRFLPHRYDRRTVAYTGTHDNDTTRGWFESIAPAERRDLERYLGRPCSAAEASWNLMRLAWASVADLAIAPLQDVLGLGSEARMNLPGSETGQWRWRHRPGQLSAPVLERLGELTATYERTAPRGEL